MVTSIRYDWCIFCTRNRAVIWQDLCGCWVFKCLHCGEVSWADCGCETPDHWDDFEAECEYMVEGGWRG